MIQNEEGEGSASKTESSSIIKICPCHTLKSYSFLTLALDGSVNFTTWSLYSPQRTPVPIEQKGGWTQGLSGRSGEGNNLLLTPGFDPRIFQSDSKFGLQEPQGILKRVNPTSKAFYSQCIKPSTRDTNYYSCYQESLVLAFRSCDKLLSLYSAFP
jgi:hypothetical protein